MCGSDLCWAPATSRIHEYCTLPGPRYIRLLELVGTVPRLSYSLRPYCLDFSPPYTALSYSWKDPVFSDEELEKEIDIDAPERNTYHEVELNGSSWMVNGSLFEALEHLSTVRDARFLWVDALCIDQTNCEEKSIQVLLMGNIYTLAARVIVWLGSEPTGLKEFAFLHQVFVPTFERLYLKYSDGLLLRSPLDPIFRTSVGLNVADWYLHWFAYFRFFRSRRWFFRAWIVQEVALASRVEIHIRDVVLSWITVNELARFVISFGWGLTLIPREQIGKDSGLGKVQCIFSMRDFYRTGGPKNTRLGGIRSEFGATLGASSEEQFWHVALLWAIETSRLQRASMAHDHVYALLGMVERFLPQGMERSITPNYSLSAEDVYVDVAAVFLQKLPYLSLLSCLEDRSLRRLENLPSWVPDWSASGTNEVLGWCNLDGMPRFDASLVEQQTTAPCSVVGRELQLRGAPLDTIADVSEPIKPMLSGYCILSCLELCSNMGIWYHKTNQCRQEALWRTMVANELNGQYPASWDASSHFYDWANALLALGLYMREKDERSYRDYVERLSCLDILSSDESALLPSKSQVTELAEVMSINIEGTDESNIEERAEFLKETDEKAMPFASRLGSVGGGRRLYRTTQGFIGLGPESTQRGDNVWLVNGARVPFIFRKVGPGKRRQSMLGETYVHGCMHGAMQELVGSQVDEIIVV